MTSPQLSEATVIVTGASRGFGRGTATALAKAGAQVVGVARDADALNDVREELGSAFTPIVADATDPVVAGQLIDTILTEKCRAFAEDDIMRQVQAWQRDSFLRDLRSSYRQRQSAEPLSPGWIVGSTPALEFS